MTTAALYEMQVDDNVCVIRFSELELDFDNCESVFSEMLAAVREHQQPMVVVVNFENVRFLHSLSINYLLELREEMEQRGGHLRLCRLSPLLRETLSITRVDRILNLFETEQQARCAS